MSFVLSEFSHESTSYCIVGARQRHLDTEVGIMIGEYHHQHFPITSMIIIIIIVNVITLILRSGLW